MYNIQINNVSLDNAKTIITAFPELLIETEDFFEFKRYNVFSKQINFETVIKILNYINSHLVINDFYEIIIK